MTVMLYRPADEPNPQVWGWNVEHKVFAEADAESAVANGWSRHPLDVKAPADLKIEIAQPGDADVIALDSKRKGRPPKGA